MKLMAIHSDGDRGEVASSTCLDELADVLTGIVVRWTRNGADVIYEGGCVLISDPGGTVIITYTLDRS